MKSSSFHDLQLYCDFRRGQGGRIVNIHLLDTHLTNQISAGEVVERPASVVKELIENSLDAGSSKVGLEILQGGMELIRIRDNGNGIHPDDLALALHPHATSKIADLSDLEKVSSLGFRGEALASIASIARVKLSSCYKEQTQGQQISAAGGEMSPTSPCAHPRGTTVEVRDLFYNTPARRKFLKSVKTEFSHIETILQRLSLSRFDVAFELIHNDKTIFSSPIAQTSETQQRRLSSILGNDFIHHALAIEFIAAGMKLWGWIAEPAFNRNQNDLQFFYVNGRFVRDKLLNHAVRQAYEDVMFNGRYPIYVLYLEIDPRAVDVNVHPTKHELRFRDSRTVHDFIEKGISDALAQIKPEVMISAPPVEYESIAFDISAIPTQKAMPLVVKEQMEVYNKLHETVPAPLVMEKIPDIEPQLGYALGQIQDIYILAQNKQGLIIVDMHAAHERILYEKLKHEIETQQIAVQTLLVPYIIELNRTEMCAWEENHAQFQLLGIQSDVSGPNSIAIRSLPKLIANAKLDTLIQDILADIIEMGSSQKMQNKVHEILGNVACRAALKAHTRLSIMQMNALLRDMENTPHSGLCNHGRPTWKLISMPELDKMFLRGR